MDIDEASVQSEREFMISALLGRLSDDDPSVVLAVLNLKPKVYTYLIIFLSLVRINKININFVGVVLSSSG